MHCAACLVEEKANDPIHKHTEKEVALSRGREEKQWREQAKHYKNNEFASKSTLFQCRIRGEMEKERKE